jgi:hypothetical protein
MGSSPVRVISKDEEGARAALMLLCSLTVIIVAWNAFLNAEDPNCNLCFAMYKAEACSELLVMVQL